MKSNKIIASLLASMLALGTFTALPAQYASNIGVGITAEAAESDFVIKTDKDGNKYIASYKGKGGDIILPKGPYVGDNAFKGNTSITSVTAPEDYYFGTSAFENCINLEKITIEGNATFGLYSFQNCINLKTVEVKGSIDVGIYAQAFSFCYSLEKVSIKKNDSKFAIGIGAFYECHSLKSINIPSKCTEIYQQAFLNCFNLETITVPSDTNFLSVDETGVMNQMGYFRGAKTEDDAWDDNWYSDVADGKTSVYSQYRATKKGGILMEDGTYFDYKKFTPKKLTMIVTKGSDAEKYAKSNGIAYKYASSSKSEDSSSKSTDKLAAPQNIKTSKTSDSIVLKWDKVEGADAYKVWIYNDKTKKYEKYKTVTGTKCTVSSLKSNTKYKFKITSLDKVDGKYKNGNTSKAVSVTTKK